MSKKALLLFHSFPHILKPYLDYNSAGTHLSSYFNFIYNLLLQRARRVTGYTEQPTWCTIVRSVFTRAIYSLHRYASSIV